MAEAVDARVAGLGAALQIAITVPPGALVSALRRDDLGAESNLWYLAAFGALVLGPAAAGVLVARKRPFSPLLHAGVATTLAWSVLALVSVVRAIAGGTDVGPLVATLLTIAPVQVGVGVLGAFLFSSPYVSAPPSRPEEIDQ